MKASLKDSRGPGKAIFHDAAIRMVTGQGYNRPSDTPPQGPMSVDTNWFTEFYEPGGSAFGLKIKAKLHDEQSAYQHIEIYDTETFGHLMVIDGCVMLTQRDNFLYHEMMAHPALFNHAAPRRVVVIGGGDCGTLREVLRHEGVQQALQVEIDERVTRLSEQYFPELCEANGDPRAQLLFEDGIAWFANAPEASVDVVIVDSTDPVGPAEGLFSEPFYRDVHRVLAPGGLIVQQSESPLYHVDLLCGVHGALRRSGFTEVKTLHYPQPVYPSGWWSATMACKDGLIRPMRLEAARRPAFATRYYSAEMHQAAFVLPPYLAAALEQVTA